MHFPKLNGYLSDFLHESELDKKSALSVQNCVTNDVKFMSEKVFSKLENQYKILLFFYPVSIVQSSFINWVPLPFRVEAALFHAPSFSVRRLREADQRRGTGGPPLQVLLRPARGPHLQARLHRPARDRGEH